MPSKKRKFPDENEKNSSNGKDDKKVVTEGDAKVKTIHTLSYIQDISDTLSNVIQDYHKELKDTNFRKNDSRSKRFFNLVEEATTCLNDGIKGITKNLNKKSMVSRLVSETRASYNKELKRREVLCNSTAVYKDINYLVHIMKTFRDNTAIDAPHQRIRMQVVQGMTPAAQKYPPPANKSHYTLLEMIKHVENSNAKVKVFHKFCADQVPPTVVCSYTTLYRHVTKYRSTGALPNTDDDGIAVGCPKLIPNNKLKKLNESLSTVGYAEGVNGLKVAMVNDIQSNQDERSMLKYAKDPCKSTLELYQTKATLVDNSVSLVKTKFSMNKTSRRQMASTSVRNLMSHIGDVAYSNFSPSTTR